VDGMQDGPCKVASLIYMWHLQQANEVVRINFKEVEELWQILIMDGW